MFVEPRSLLIFTEDAYHNYLHSIGDNKIDSIAFYYQVDKATGEKTMKINDVANIEKTSVWRKICSGDVDSREGILVEDEEKFSVYSFEGYFKRERRESMTIRYVTEKKL